MSRTIQLCQIADLNRATYSKRELPEVLYYLDTGSLTKNKIEGFLELNKTIDKVPSRAKRKVQQNTILYSTVRPNQEHHGIIENGFPGIVVSTGFTTIDITDRNVNPKYLYYLLTQKHLTEYLHSIAQNSVSSYPSISPGDLAQLNLKIPRLIEQTRIAKVLSDLDTKIAVNNKINQELEALAKTIYDYWFVQFDFPDKNGKPYKSSGGKMVYNEELKTEIPEGWEVKTIGKTLDVILGGTPSTKIDEYWNGDISWLNSGEISNFPIIDSELKITQEGIDNSATVLMPIGTCVLSITRHLRASILAVDSCANQSVVGLLESESLKSPYIYPYLINELPRLMSLRTGAQQPHINKGTVEESYILIPDKTVLKLYYSRVKSLYDKIIIHSKENQKLAALRDWLLPMLMNGQVRVGENNS